MFAYCRHSNPYEWILGPEDRDELRAALLATTDGYHRSLRPSGGDEEPLVDAVERIVVRVRREAAAEARATAAEVVLSFVRSTGTITADHDDELEEIAQEILSPGGGSVSWHAINDLAVEHLPCPYCRAKPGEACVAQPSLKKARYVYSDRTRVTQAAYTEGYLDGERDGRTG